MKRHNRLRNVLAGRLSAAGLSPEPEKPGLLPARPEEHGCCESGASPPSGRRPADVFVPAWGIHGPAAFDLAVTSGMRSGSLRTSAGDGSAAVRDYEARKCQYKNTQQQCADQGLQFVPLVVEACAGGWGGHAVRVWRQLGGLLAGRHGTSTSEQVQHLLQIFSVVLQRESARAVLRRLPGPTPESASAFSDP
eukprot:Skav211832  [mRNA]  locus=scaffold305:639454:640032:- [translate_table: standard]